MRWYESLVEHAKIVWDKTAIFFSKLKGNQFDSQHVIGDIISLDLELQSQGQMLESIIFLKFIYDYLANNGRYGISYYWQWMGSHTWDFDCYIYVLTLAHSRGQGHAQFDNEYVGNGER